MHVEAPSFHPAPRDEYDDWLFADENTDGEAGAYTRSGFSLT